MPETPVERKSENRKKNRIWVSFKKKFINNTIIGGNPLFQQTMPGWFGYISFLWVSPVYILFFLIFTGIGVLLLVSSLQHGDEIKIRYDNVNRYRYPSGASSEESREYLRSYTIDGNNHSQGVRTTVNFTLGKKMTAPVYIYYALDKYYQNFRTFAAGRSTQQLRGLLQSKWGTLWECEPYTHPGFSDRGENAIIQINASFSLNATDFTYNPCGSFPWAMFNDTFALYGISAMEKAIDTHHSDSHGSSILRSSMKLICNTSDFDPVGNILGFSNNYCRKKGISFRADTDIRYKKLVKGERIWSLHYPGNPINTYLLNGWYLGEPGHSLPNPLDLDFQVWMRIALLPKFRKLFRIINIDLEPGQYVMEIDEFYDVTSFGGKKYFVLSSARPIANGTRGIAIVFLVLGASSFVLGVAFAVEAFVGKPLSSKLSEPKRSWYVYDPSSPEFELYDALRVKRYVPLIELQALREEQSAK